MKKSAVTQQMVNLYPAWSSIRRDEQSLGHQIANATAINLEELQKQLQRGGLNYHLPTVNLDEIDLIYAFELDPSSEFNKVDEDSAEIDYVTPTVSGRLGSTWYPVDLAANNNIETFWDKSVPTRFTTTVVNSGSCTVLAEVTTSGSPVLTFDNEPHLQGRVHVTVTSGTKFLRSENNEVVRGTVILTGTTRKDTEESETMIFLYDDTQTTLKEWESFDEVRTYGIDPQGGFTLSISSCQFNSGPYKDFYNVDYSEGANKVDTFWNVGTTDSGINTLDMVRFSSDDFSNIVIAQLTQKETVQQIELLDVDGNVISTPLDMALQPFQDRAWVCTASGLLLYDLERPYPDLGKMTKKQYDSFVRVDVDSYHKVFADDVELTYRLVRPIVDVAKHRVSIEFPDGTKYAIISGVLTLLTAGLDYWEFGVLNETLLREQDILTLGQRGDYIVTLEVVFSDNTSNIDQRIVTVDSKRALAALDLPFTDAGGVQFDSDQKLWVLDSLGVHHRIDLATDVMLVDFEQKTIFFHEQYEEVTVIL
jgi:hypothetical protein